MLYVRSIKVALIVSMLALFTACGGAAVDVTGTWVGTFSNGGDVNNTVLVLQQQGSSVNGTLGSISMSGSVSGNSLSMSGVVEGVTVTLNGQVNGNSMNGTITIEGINFSFSVIRQ